MTKETFVRKLYLLLESHKEEDLRDIEKLLVEYEIHITESGGIK